MSNRFASAENVMELIYQLVGAGSTCWVGGTRDAVFDTDQAKQVADAGINRLIELDWCPLPMKLETRLGQEQRWVTPWEPIHRAS